jgi:hypothetical protein
MSISGFVGNRQDIFSIKMVFDKISTFAKSPKMTFTESMHCGETNWKVGFGPNGASSDLKGNCCLCIENLDKTDVTVDVKFTVLSHCNSVATPTEIISKERIIFTKDKYVSMMSDIGSKWTFKYFTANRGAQTRPVCFVVDDTAYLTLDLIIHSTMAKVNKDKRISQWWSDVPSMSGHKASSDVVLKVGKTRIPTHKFILCLKSRVFRAMFDNRMRESSSSEVAITDFPEAVVRSMLRCLYDPSCIDAELATGADQLLAIADKYEICDLIELAEQKLVENLTPENAVQTFKFADTYGRASIKKAALKVMVSNTAKVFTTPNLPFILGNALCEELFHYLGNNCIVVETTAKHEPSKSAAVLQVPVGVKRKYSSTSSSSDSSSSDED